MKKSTCAKETAKSCQKKVDDSVQVPIVDQMFFFSRFYSSERLYSPSLIPMPKVTRLKLIRISLANGENRRRCEQEGMKT